MSSGEDTPEEVSLQAGKAAFDEEKRKEEQHNQLDSRVKKQRKQEKRKREAAAAEEKTRKLIVVNEAQSDEQELDLLPEDVVQAVLDRVGEQEIQDRNVEVKHGRIVAVGRKHNAVEVTKGPVIVKVLDMDAAPPMSGNALSFRDKVLGRHRRSKRMLRK